MNERISVVIKVTNACNLKCKYCYDANNKEKCFIKKEYIIKLFDILSTKYNEIQVIWHGGEPLLIGLDFYKWVVNIQKEYNVKFYNKMQTNGTLLTDEFAKFLIENDFHIGMSYDGGNEKTGRQMQDKTLENRNLVIKYGSTCGFVNIVNAYNIDDLEKLYDFYKEQNIGVTFSCIFPSGNAKENTELLIKPEKYIEKLKILFDKWLLEEDTKSKVTPLDDYLNAYLGKCKKCSYGSCLFKWLCIDAFGNLYPCGRIMNEKYCMGHIDSINNFDEIFNNDNYKSIVSEAIKRRNKCKNCDIYEICNGGCNSDALLSGSIKNNGHSMCIVNKEMFTYTKNAFDEIKSGKRDCNNKYILNKLK